MNHEFYEWKEDSLFLNIYLQPSSDRNEIVGVYNEYLKIKVRAKPIEDEANHALIVFLAKAFDLPKSQVHLLQGKKSRWKRLELCKPKKLIEGVQR
ncbi:MAG: DUF167 family protein [Pseudomonadota bacterium]|nr:DUF167 domain-containing protein [Gammaproteobacteria bacterium]MBU1559039.1 DUF167 domain-containing protein [Gammaproteobacteria bacterium]MBU1926983.1 DUF167 domain-containing protein [Gammaproteobacteria bacterium]MBU2546124.1 DUF167 domain-containing protein [Gammaproteobacteria bacterium]